MPSTILYDASPSLTTVIHHDATTPTLKNLASNGRKLGSEINNATALNQYGLFELTVKGASAFTTGGYVELYLIPCADGSNYADGDDATDPPSSCLAGIFPLQAVDTQQRLTIWGVVLPPVKFKPLIINRGGQDFSNSDSENSLRFGAYNDEVQ